MFKLNELLSKLSNLESDVWKRSIKTIPKRSVKLPEHILDIDELRYLTLELNEGSLKQLETTMESIRNHLRKTTAQIEIDKRLGKEKIEDYLGRFINKSQNYHWITPEHTVTCISRDNTIEDDLMAHYIQVILYFYNKLDKEGECLKYPSLTENYKKWMHLLISTMLRNASFDSHKFLLKMLKNMRDVSQRDYCKYFNIPILHDPSYNDKHYIPFLYDIFDLLLAPVYEEKPSSTSLQLVSNEDDIIGLYRQYPVEFVVNKLIDMIGVDHSVSFSWITAFIDCISTAMSVYEKHTKFIEKLFDLLLTINQRISTKATILVVEGYHFKGNTTAFKAQMDNLLLRSFKVMMSMNNVKYWPILQQFPYYSLSPTTSIFLYNHILKTALPNQQIDVFVGDNVLSSWVAYSRSKKIQESLSEFVSSNADMKYYLNIITVLSLNQHDQNMKKAVLFDLMYVGYILSQSEVTDHIKQLIQEIVNKNPQFISYLIQQMDKYCTKLDTRHEELFKCMPIDEWNPTDQDCTILCSNWIKDDCNFGTRHVVSRLVLDRICWSTEISAVDPKKANIPYETHRIFAVEITRTYNYLKTEYQSKGLFSSFKKSSFIEFENWCTKIITKIRYFNHQGFPSIIEPQDDGFVELDSRDTGVVKDMKDDTEKNRYLLNINLISAYMSLVTTPTGLNSKKFWEQGIYLLRATVLNSKFNMTLRLLFDLVPLSFRSRDVDQRELERLVAESGFAQHILRPLLGEVSLNSSENETVSLQDNNNMVRSKLNNLIVSQILREGEVDPNNVRNLVIFWSEQVLSIGLQEEKCYPILDDLAKLSLLFGYQSEFHDVFQRSFTDYKHALNLESGFIKFMSKFMKNEKTSLFSPQTEQILHPYLSLHFMIASIDHDHQNWINVVGNTLIKDPQEKIPENMFENMYGMENFCLRFDADHPINVLYWKCFFKLFLSFVVKTSGPTSDGGSTSSFETKIFGHIIPKLKYNLLIDRLEYCSEIYKLKINKSIRPDDIERCNHLRILYHDMKGWISSVKSEIVSSPENLVGLVDTVCKLCLTELLIEHDSVPFSYVALKQRTSSSWNNLVDLHDIHHSLLEKDRKWRLQGIKNMEKLKGLIYTNTNIFYPVGHTATAPMTENIGDNVLSFVKLVPVELGVIGSDEFYKKYREDINFIIQCATLDIKNENTIAHLDKYYISLFPKLFNNVPTTRSRIISYTYGPHKTSASYEAKDDITEPVCNEDIKKIMKKNRDQVYPLQKLVIDDALIKALLRIESTTFEFGKIEKKDEVANKLFFITVNAITRDMEYQPYIKSLIDNVISFYYTNVSVQKSNLKDILKAILKSDHIGKLLIGQFDPNITDDGKVYLELLDILLSNYVKNKHNNINHLALLKFDIEYWLSSNKNNIKYINETSSLLLKYMKSKNKFIDSYQIWNGWSILAKMFQFILTTQFPKYFETIVKQVMENTENGDISSIWNIITDVTLDDLPLDKLLSLLSTITSFVETLSSPSLLVGWRDILPLYSLLILNIVSQIGRHITNNNNNNNTNNNKKELVKIQSDLVEKYFLRIYRPWILFKPKGISNNNNNDNMKFITEIQPQTFHNLINSSVSYVFQVQQYIVSADGDGSSSSSSSGGSGSGGKSGSDVIKYAWDMFYYKLCKDPNIPLELMVSVLLTTLDDQRGLSSSSHFETMIAYNIVFVMFVVAIFHIVLPSD
eukprot:TRINITY_DN1734_c0_g1_i3.p1 TRINITY_DN1734_c0_g1~~TRINITY_DN1734_c0_g1_i3.p1  ORF type:complete len:1701 (+),score=344.37 TRINITY_DN1734_c0_g1_i3:497-5599(+)